MEKDVYSGIVIFMIPLNSLFPVTAIIVRVNLY